LLETHIFHRLTNAEFNDGDIGEERKP